MIKVTDTRKQPSFKCVVCAGNTYDELDNDTLRVSVLGGMKLCKKHELEIKEFIDEREKSKGDTAGNEPIFRDTAEIDPHRLSA